MKTLAWALAVVLIAGLLVAELAMDVTPADRRLLYTVFNQRGFCGSFSSF